MIKRGLVVLFLFADLALYGTNYYVATNGSDSNPGTISQPFATWQKGVDVANAGDVVYIRGGVYYTSGISQSTGYCGVFLQNKNGTSSNPISIVAYQGEQPILDCSGMTEDGVMHLGMSIESCSYLYLKGLEIRYVSAANGNISIGISFFNTTNSTFEALASHGNDGPGFGVDGDNNLFIYCDAYDNYDIQQGGENADGFIFGKNTARTTNTLKDCRSWHNSDDGFDTFGNEGTIIYSRCWSFNNGYGANGDGDGFKLGATYLAPLSTPQKVLTNCLAENNLGRGFDQSEGNVLIDLYNNTSYNNKSQGFFFGDGGNLALIIKNNISYDNASPDIFQSNMVLSNNSWQNNLVVTDADFITLSDAGIDGSRNSDGTLPDINFLHLAAGSDLIDAGTDVGLPYNGSAPDLGYFESGSATTVAVPQYVSSVIQNSSPSKIDMTFSLALGSNVPAISAFKVTVNSASRTVSSVTVSGATVSLTLASAVAYGDAVTVAYTQPSSNPLQTSAGGQVASFSAQNVTNNVASVTTVTAPVYVSSSVENATPTKLNIVYSLSLANTVPAASAFSVTVNSSSRTVSSVAVSGTTVSLTLASAVAHGDAVTVAYTKPSSNPLQTSAGGQVASFSAQKVTNNVASVTTVTAPVYVSSSVENATPTKLNIVYSLSLANTVPAASAFSVTVNSASRTVNSVAVSGTNVVLTLSSAVIYGDAVKLSYTKPSSNPLQTSAGGQAASFSTQTVANNVQLGNSPPVVMVNYESTSYSGFVNELDASGSYDPNKDNLTFSWVVPSNISVSSTTGSVIKYLSPASDATQKVQFVLNVSDGKTTTSKAIPVEINPYEPGLDVAEVAKVEASSYSAPNYPSNIIDGNIGTMWAANGDDQWLLLTLKEEFSVQYVDIAFESGQAKESFFDIMGSDDMNTWETILTKSNSCAFSGALQVFNFPASKTENEFRYIKIIGHGNSTDNWNYISEFRIFGYKHKNPTSYEAQPVKIYPNPAKDNFNVRIDETSVVCDFLRIISLTGKVLLQHKIDPDVSEFNVAINLLKGVYLIQMGAGNTTLFSQKLVVSY